MIDRSRRHLTTCRAWRRLGREHVVAQRPPLDPTATRHHRRLVLVVPPDCDDRDPEVQQIATQLGVEVTHGGSDGVPPTRYLHRARSAGGDPDESPVLLWEEWVVDERLVPVYQAPIACTRLPLSAAEWRAVSAAQPVAVLPDPLWAEVHLLQGAPTHVALTHQRRRLGSAVVDSRLLDPEEPTHAPVRDGVARLSLPTGVWHVVVEARGSGVVEAGALIVGRLELLERHRRYHLVR